MPIALNVTSNTNRYTAGCGGRNYKIKQLVNEKKQGAQEENIHYGYIIKILADINKHHFSIKVYQCSFLYSQSFIQQNGG